MIKQLYILLSTLLLIFTSTYILADTNTKQFQDALKYANSLKGAAKEAIVKSKFMPEEVFRDQKGGYTENPSQINYYQGVEQGNTYDMERSARTEVSKDENYKAANGEAIPTPGKIVVNGFSAREVFKIDKNDEFMIKGKVVTNNARNIVTGVPNQNINCENKKDKKEIECKIEYIEKSCNEEVRTIQKICEYVPKIDFYEDVTEYQNCRKIDVRQGHRNGCQGGYRQLLYTDMIEGPTWDDIFLCDKHTSGNENNECYMGYMVQGRYHGNNRRNDYENVWAKGRVPKKMQGYIRFMHTYDGHMSGTIFNETKNHIYQGGDFVNGQVVRLPFSETEDQVFRVDINNKKSSFWFSDNTYKGVVIIYVDRINKKQAAKFDSWQEVTCNEK